MAEKLEIGKASKDFYASYYSGADIRVYFGDMWVDEIVEIGFTLQEQVAPVYGYASFTWDTVARGNRYVSGQFTVNFKEVGYLHNVIERLSYEQTEENEWFSLEEYNSKVTKEIEGKQIDLGYQKDLPIDTVIDNFDFLANDYEVSIWGYADDKNKFRDFTNNRTSDSYFYSARLDKNNKKMKDKGFNILLTYGGLCDNGRDSTNYRTAQSIVGVQLTGVSQQVDPSGNPILETYSFVAKDLNNNVTLPA